MKFYYLFNLKKNEPLYMGCSLSSTRKKYLKLYTNKPSKELIRPLLNLRNLSLGDIEIREYSIDKL